MAEQYVPWNTLLPINKNALPFGSEPGSIPFEFEYDYRWVFICATIVAFLAAAGIGANDVANSFATSVGSKSLTLIQAVFIASIFEFTGAVSLGAGVTDTIKGGIVNPKSFENGNEDLLMAGMFAALISTTFWLFAATYFELPVSTTHSIVGAVVGFGIVVPFADVDWGLDWENGKGLGYVMIGWVVAPGISGICSAIFFALIRTFILRSKNSFNRTLVSFPIIAFFVVGVNVFLTINKGAKGKKWKKTLGGNWGVLGVSAACGLFVALVIQFALIPVMRKRLENVEDEEEKTNDIEGASQDTVIDGPSVEIELENGPREIELGNIADINNGTKVKEVVQKDKKSMWEKIKANDDKIHNEKSEKVTAIHDSAEKFEKRTELAFGYLQVMTACAMSFAHGANDVANAIGPLASIVSIYDNNGLVSKKVPVETWILALGGAGIAFGLLVYGWKIIRALGVKLIKISPARGSCIELATAFTIVIGSVKKLPLSTTQVMVGATLGVGILDSFSKNRGEGVGGGINKLLLLKIFSGWVLTLLVAAGFSAMIFSFMVYSPSMVRPLAQQNCMADYGQVAETDQTVTLLANVSTVLIGNKNTGDFVTGF